MFDRAASHKPNRWGDYIQIHQTAIGQCLDSGKVSEDNLHIAPAAERKIVFDGWLLLRDGRLRLDVTKELEIVVPGSDPFVQTVQYSYNVLIAGHGNVFRYCSPHRDQTIEHHRQHHRHQYDPFGPNRETYTVTLIEDGNWPSLSQVIDEADAWYWENLEALHRLA